MLDLPMETYTVVYKSGTKVRIRAKNLRVTKFTNGAIEVKWDEMRPKPFLLGVDDIAAIYQGKV